MVDAALIGLANIRRSARRARTFRSPCDEMRATWQSVLNGPEGRVLLVGIALSLAVVIALAVSALWSAGLSQLLTAVIATNLVFGRVAAMSLGYAAGLDHLTVILTNLVVETLLVLVFYPLFVLSWRHLVEWKALRPYLNAVGEAAERHRESIRRYGIIGLFVFVWSPFWMTGPLVGSAIGFLLGLSLRVTLAVVLAGTGVAIVCWSWAIGALHEQAARVSALGPLALLAFFVLVAATGYLLRRRARRSRP